MFPGIRFEVVGCGCSVEQSFDYIMKEKVGLLIRGHHPRTNHPVHGNSVARTFIIRIRSSFNLNMHNDIYHRARILIAISNNILLM